MSEELIKKKWRHLRDVKGFGWKMRWVSYFFLWVEKCFSSEKRWVWRFRDVWRAFTRAKRKLKDFLMNLCRFCGKTFHFLLGKKVLKIFHKSSVFTQTFLCQEIQEISSFSKLSSNLQAVTKFLLSNFNYLINYKIVDKCNKNLLLSSLTIAKKSYSWSESE